MTYTYKHASELAVAAKKDVAKLVSITSDFVEIPWFKIGLTVEQGNQLKADIKRHHLSVPEVFDRPHMNGLRIHGVNFYWDKLKQEAA